MSFIDGTYTLVKDESSVPFMLNTGITKEECKKLMGTHWTYYIKRVGEGNTFVSSLTCDELPEYNMLDTYIEGVEKKVDTPALGGVCTMTFTAKGNTLTSASQSEKHGRCETIEEYSEDGVTFKIKSLDTGATLTEFMERKIKLDGWFRYKKDENMLSYFKAKGIPDMYQAMKQTKSYSQWCGNTVISKEYFGDQVIESRFTLDEESDYNFPGYESKVLLTKMGPGRYKAIGRDTKGGVEEWDMIYNDEGQIMKFLDRKTGVTATVESERFTNFCGEFKPVALSGYDAFLPAVGMPSELVSKAVTEWDARHIIDMKDDILRVQIKSKYMPMDFTCKIGEEYEMQIPGTSDTIKCIDTIDGDKMIRASKGQRFTVSSEAKFTENFVIVSSHIVGTQMRTKLILERC